MMEEAGSLTGALEYRTDLFEAATITRLLEPLPDRAGRASWPIPHQRLADVPLLTACRAAPAAGGVE